MTLAQRILISISLLVALVTLALSLAVQNAWETTAQEQFVADFNLATTRLRQQLTEEVARLPAQLEPLCKHSQMVDSTLTALRANALDRERKYAISLLVPATQEAFGFDELILLTAQGEVLGAHQPGRIGTIDRALAERTKQAPASTLRSADGQWRIEAHCRKTGGKQAVALHAAKYLDTIFERVGALHGLNITHTAPADRAARFTRMLELPELRGTALFASPRRMTVEQAVAQLNVEILRWGAGVLAVAVLLGYWFARRLARPIVELSQQARRVIHGEPLPIRARGAPELREFADSFNRTLEELARMRDRAAAVERIAAQREIARRVAHEVKNPLAPIRAAIETLRRLRARNDPAFDEYFDEATRTVLSEVRRITAIVGEFTEFARLPSPKPVEFDFDEMLRSVVQFHEAHGVEIALSSPGPLTIRADRDQCVQVTTNLLQNALDAVAAQERPVVQVGLETTGDHITLTVSDSGPGIAEEIRAEVFKPYVTGKSKGTGLGLAIVQRIVVEHAGEVTVTASDLGGATFTVRLPVAGPDVLIDSSV